MPADEQRLEHAAKLFSAGRLDQAKAMLLSQARKRPRDPDVARILCLVLAQKEEFSQAHHYAMIAAAASPGDADLNTTLANIELGLGRLDDAKRTLGEILRRHPEHVEARRTLASLLVVRGDLLELVEVGREGMSLHPRLADFWFSAGTALLNLGRAEEARALLTRAKEHCPESLEVASCLAMSHTYDPTMTPAQSAAGHRAFGAVLDRRIPRATPPPIRDADPARTIHVGIISAELHKHAVSFMIAGLLEHHDRERLRITVYSMVQDEDACTERLRGWADRWVNVMGEGNERICARMREDRVDVLIELAGHTGWSALPLMQHRPAPIQVTYMGYASTTGVGTIDYRIVDSITDPPGTEAFSTERLLRLDPTWPCCRHLIDFPPVALPPCVRPPHSVERPGPVTFGCLSTILKVNDTLFACWGSLLRALPGSTLLLKGPGLSSDAARSHVIERMERAGCPREQLALEAPAPGVEALLPHYNRVDIVLDTYPYNGILTACEAMMMGAPLLSLIGDRSSSRTALSIARAMGLEGTCATSPEEFTRLGVAMASDVTRLVRLREALRPTFLASPLGDARSFALRFERLLRGAWRERCAGAGTNGTDTAFLAR